MTSRDKALRALDRLERIVNTAKVHVSEDGTKSVVHFDGVLIEPFDALKMAEHFATIRDHLENS